MFSALQLDKEVAPDWPTFKRAFTPSAVRQIHEAVIRLWPPDTDLSLVLEPEQDAVRALYVGDYEADLLARGVTRHCLYADKVTLVDPFVYSIGVNPQYSPLEYPEHYRANSIRSAQIWFQFMEWIDHGLVEFVRTPGDFDRGLWHAILRAERARFESSPELQALARQYVNEKMKSPELEEYRRHHALLFPPDSHLLRSMQKFDPNMSKEMRDAILERVRREREEHPFYVEPIPDKDGNVAEIYQMATGMGHMESRLAASIMGGYLVTDIVPRWRMIEMDREYEKIDVERWSPLAKAFGEVRLRYLDGVRLHDALRLREEDRLEGLRAFLRRVHHASGSSSPYGDSIATDMAAELTAQVGEAEAAWNAIDQDLVKWLGVEAAAVGVPALAVGGAAWAAAGLALAVAGGINLGMAHWKRKDFTKAMPAAFFMDLKKREAGGLS